MTETIREFIVGLDWKTDQAERDTKRFETAITTATVKAQILADILIAVAKKIGEVVAEVSTKFDGLFFAAQRLNTSAALANDFPLLIKKYGGNPAEASGLLEAAALRLRENANNISILNKLGFGLNATTGKLEVQQEMLENLRHLDTQQIESMSALIGISAQPILLMKRHIDEVMPDLKAFDDYRKALGVDVDKSAADGNAFWNVWRNIQPKLEAILGKIGDGLAVAFTPLLTELDKFLTLYAKDIGAAIQIVVDALADMFKTWAADFDKILDNPDTMHEFAHDVREVANAIGWLARKLSDLIGVLRALATMSDVLNYLAGNDANPEAYARGKEQVDHVAKEFADPKNKNGFGEGDVKGGLEYWKGKAGDAVEWGKRKLGFGGDAPAAAGGAADAPAATGKPPVIFGDSIGLGLAGAVGADGSNAVQGKGTGWVRDRIAAYRKSLAGQDVVISSGSSNDTRSAANVRAQIAAAIAKGADPKRITILGVGSLATAVGNYPGASDTINATLAREAAAAGARFQPLPAGTDVHPDYKALARSLAPAPQPAPPAAKPEPPGQLPPMTIPRGSIGSFAEPLSSLGGEGGGTHISAARNTTIRVDGAGDPAAVARLVHKAQKGVNADLSETLGQAT